MKKYARVGMAAAALISMWGILYPELYLNPDVIRAVQEDGSVLRSDSPSDYVRFLDADGEDITVKSKLAECLLQYLDPERDGGPSAETEEAVGEQ